MEDSNKDFHISFFKPTTAQAKSNRNIVIWFVCIWAVAIFGFQFALYFFQEEKKEPSLELFEEVWQQVKTEQASEVELQKFSYSALSVLGKVFIKPEMKTALDNGLSWAVYQLADSIQKAEVVNGIILVETKASEIEDIQDKSYLLAKEDISKLVSGLIGLEDTDVRTKLVPIELVSTSINEFSDEDKLVIEQGMATYLTHNQSFLTDTKFLGFPFHYFYTAIFLLILFVGLCWLYCYRIDQINTKLNIAD